MKGNSEKIQKKMGNWKYADNYKGHENGRI